MLTAFLISVSVLMIAGASFILVISVRGKPRPGFGRSWGLQNAAIAVGQYFMALMLLSLSQMADKRHPLGLSSSQLFTSTGIGIATLFMCCLFAMYVGVLRLYRRHGLVIRLPHWMYGWIVDENDTYRLGQRTARANGATDTGATQ